ncbi:MAG: hypothetical protein R2762_26615 [Bryobacteraceae bacterium]
MNGVSLLAVLLPVLMLAEAQPREQIYADTGPAAPRFDKGHLLSLQRPNRLKVFRPGGALAFDVVVSCPGSEACSASAVAVDGRGRVAVSVGTPGRQSGIEILTASGQREGFIATQEYVANALCFDSGGNLWSLGFQRDRHRPDVEEKEDYFVVRKFSPDGAPMGGYLARSLWPGAKSQPGRAGGGYWTMSAGGGRIGAVIHENHSDNPAEWMEWNERGELVSRTVIPSAPFPRAYGSDGRLYGMFGEGPSRQLQVLDTASRTWHPVAAMLPAGGSLESSFLIGADGGDLVYRAGARLLWVRPGPR